MDLCTSVSYSFPKVTPEFSINWHREKVFWKKKLYTPFLWGLEENTSLSVSLFCRKSSITIHLIHLLSLNSSCKLPASNNGPTYMDTTYFLLVPSTNYFVVTFQPIYSVYLWSVLVICVPLFCPFIILCFPLYLTTLMKIKTRVMYGTADE